MRGIKMSSCALSLAIGVGVITAAKSPLQATVEFSSAQTWRRDTQSVRVATLSDIWNWLRRQRVPGGSRGQVDFNGKPVCAIAPGDLQNTETAEVINNKVWSQEPVFVWQDVWTQLEVKHSRSHETMLSQTLQPDQRSLSYADVADAKPLQPGQAYYWMLSDANGLFGETSFVVMNDTDHDAIATALEQRLQSVEGIPENILRARVQFFGEQRLVAEMLRELYTAPNLPTDLLQEKQALAETNFCATVQLAN